MSARISIGLACVFALAACGSSPQREVHLYTLSVADTAPARPQGTGPTLRLLAPEIAPGLAGITVRRDETRVDQLVWHRWVAPLASLVEDGVRAAIERGGHFGFVLGSRSPGAADRVLALRVARFEIEDGLVTGGPVAAVVEIEATTWPEGTRKVGFARRFRQRREVVSPIEVPAMVQALDAAFSAVAAELATALAPGGDTAGH